MKKLIIILFTVIICIFVFCGCEGNPYLSVRHSYWNYDDENFILHIEKGYYVDPSNRYEVVNTEDGFDVILHYVPEHEDNGKVVIGKKFD